MGSSTAHSVVLVGLVACAQPNVSVDVDRTADAAVTVSMILCPLAGLGSPKCKTVPLLNTDGVTAHQDIFIEDSATKFTIYLSGEQCYQIDIDVGPTVALRYTLPAPPTCTPASSCTITTGCTP